MEKWCLDLSAIHTMSCVTPWMQGSQASRARRFRGSRVGATIQDRALVRLSTQIKVETKGKLVHLD